MENKKAEYEEPTAEVVSFEEQDVVAESLPTEMDEIPDKP